MANKQYGNSFYVDTSGNSLVADNILIHYVLYTATSAAGDVLLLDASGGSEFLRFEGATANETKCADFSRNPISLPNGLHVTVTNCKATIVFTRAGTGRA